MSRSFALTLMAAVALSVIPSDELSSMSTAHAQDTACLQRASGWLDWWAEHGGLPSGYACSPCPWQQTTCRSCTKTGQTTYVFEWIPWTNISYSIRPGTGSPLSWRVDCDCALDSYPPENSHCHRVN